MKAEKNCLPAHIVDIILTEVKPEIINGFKAKDNLAEAMGLMAAKVGDSAFLGPYLDGTAMMNQSLEEIYCDASTVIDIFSSNGCRFSLGAISADCHPVENLAKLNAVMRASTTK